MTATNPRIADSSPLAQYMRLSPFSSVAAMIVAATAGAAAAKPDLRRVPGVVIDHMPAATGLYIGSPSLADAARRRLRRVARYFGPKSTEHQSAVTAVFRSADRGQTWQKIAEIQGQFWSTLFVHRGALYLLGTDRHHGNAIIRRSDDGGATWTSPRDPHERPAARQRRSTTAPRCRWSSTTAGCGGPWSGAIRR